jgi:mannose/fructose/N-acetylgalactosamine-specific phosphotransferase system component IID
MNIPIGLAGALCAAWLAIAIPTVVHLAGRKTDTRMLTMFWGVVAALVPFIGLLFILGLLLKDDRPTA